MPPSRRKHPSSRRPAIQGLCTTPWSTWTEWSYLYHLAKHGPPAAAAPALATYRARLLGDLPLAIDSTFVLQSLLSGPTTYAARLGLALALVRLVNGLTDRLQPRSEKKIPRAVARLAAAAGLPRHWVSLRHEAVHSELPSWTELVSTGRGAVNWLFRRYWEPQAEAVRIAATKAAVGGPSLPGGAGVYAELRYLAAIFEQRGEVRGYGGGEEVRPALPRDSPGTCGGGGRRNRHHTADADAVLADLLVAFDHRVAAVTAADAADAVAAAVGAIGASVAPPTTTPRHRYTRLGVWRRCPNAADWAATAIGLAPGQRRVPFGLVTSALGLPAASEEDVDGGDGGGGEWDDHLAWGWVVIATRAGNMTWATAPAEEAGPSASTMAAAAATATVEGATAKRRRPPDALPGELSSRGWDDEGLRVAKRRPVRPLRAAEMQVVASLVRVPGSQGGAAEVEADATRERTGGG
ncbi:hypothetical protein MMPV_002328 [Pyropia vietnamensis]